MPSRCRFCRSELTDTVVDLGLSPISNEFRDAATVDTTSQIYYPLKVMICRHCWLVQLTDVETPEHFNANYAYFSSYSTSWLEHARIYSKRMINQVSLDNNSLVIEVASNDGYLLQYFKQAGIPVLGIEPSANVREVAQRIHGIKTIDAFFGLECANQLVMQGLKADLIIANNVLAHVPNINDFASGFAPILRPGGTITFEFPHILNMLRYCQFDTIYHEHFTYLSLGVVERILQAHGLAVYGAEKIPTHGGSLRVFVSHKGTYKHEKILNESLERLRIEESAYNLESLATYTEFYKAVVYRKAELLSFLIKSALNGKKVIGYGAPAKGNTLLNYCGIGPDLLSYTVDISPHKQGLFLPGVNILVEAPDKLLADRPDYIFILPWNLREEITKQLFEARDWGGHFFVAIPKLEVF